MLRKSVFALLVLFPCLPLLASDFGVLVVLLRASGEKVAAQDKVSLQKALDSCRGSRSYRTVDGRPMPLSIEGYDHDNRGYAVLVSEYWMPEEDEHKTEAQTLRYLAPDIKIAKILSACISNKMGSKFKTSISAGWW